LFAANCDDIGNDTPPLFPLVLDIEAVVPLCLRPSPSRKWQLPGRRIFGSLIDRSRATCLCMYPYPWLMLSGWLTLSRLDLTMTHEHEGVFFAGPGLPDRGLRPRQG
jgi:hypothetical protein